MRTTVGLRFFGFVFRFAVEIFGCQFSTKLVEFFESGANAKLFGKNVQPS